MEQTKVETTQTKDQQISINVKTLDNKVYNLQIPSNIKIIGLKQKIEKEIHVPVDRQRLVSMGKLMKDDEQLDKYITENDQTIHLMARIEAAQPDVSQQQTSPIGQQQQPPQQHAQFMRGPQNITTSFTAQMPMGAAGGLPFDISSIFNGLGSIINQISQPQHPRNNVNANQGNQQSQPANITSTTQQQQQHRTTSNSVNPPSQIQTATQNAGAQTTLPRQDSPQMQESIQTQAQNQPHLTIVPIIPSQLQPIRRKYLEYFTSSTIQLPVNTLETISQMIDDLLGVRDSFPTPMPPQLNVQRNPLFFLGQFISFFSFEIQRVQPYIGRLGDVLQRESSITSQTERANVQIMSSQLSDILDLIFKVIGELLRFLVTLSMGPNPGQFAMEARLVQGDQSRAYQSHNSDGLDLFIQDIGTLGSQLNRGSYNEIVQRAQQIQQNQNTHAQTHMHPNLNSNNHNNHIPNNTNNITIEFTQGTIHQANPNDQLDATHNAQSQQQQQTNHLEEETKNQQQNQHNHQSQNQKDTSIQNNENKKQIDSNNNSHCMDIDHEFNSDNGSIEDQARLQMLDGHRGHHPSANINIGQNGNVGFAVIDIDGGEMEGGENPDFQSLISNLMGHLGQGQNSGAFQFMPSIVHNHHQAQAMRTQANPQPPQSQQNHSFQQQEEQQQQVQDKNQSSQQKSLFDMTVKEVVLSKFHANMSQSQLDFLELVGTFQVKELVAGIMSDDYSFLFHYRQQNRHSLEKIILSYQGNSNKVIDDMFGIFMDIILPESVEQQKYFHMGFDPKLAAEELVKLNLRRYFDILLSMSEDKQETYVERMTQFLKNFMGELIYQLSEGTQNGISDFKNMFNGQVQKRVTSVVDASHASIVSNILTDNLWTKLNDSYVFYLNHKLQSESNPQAQSQSQQQQQVNCHDEQSLLQNIRTNLNMDKTQLEQQKPQPLSQAYLQGNLNLDSH